MRSFFGPRGGGADVSDQPRVLAYLETVFNQRYGKDAVGLRTSGEMRTNWRSSDSAVQGSGNFRHQRHLAAGSTSRAYSRGRCRTCLCGRASGHFAVGAPATEAHGGGQQEMGNRQRGACRVKFGGAPCESSSQGSQNRSIPSDQEERRKKQK